MAVKGRADEQEAKSERWIVPFRQEVGNLNDGEVLLVEPGNEDRTGAFHARRPGAERRRDFLRRILPLRRNAVGPGDHLRPGPAAMDEQLRDRERRHHWGCRNSATVVTRCSVAAA